MRLEPVARFVTVVLTVCGTIPAQSMVKPGDVAAAQGAFDAAPAAPRLRCSFRALSPALDYALRFRTGYKVSFPLRQLAGSNHSLAVLLRVTPDGRRPVYLAVAGSLPPVPDEKLEGETQGRFVVGEGGYTVEALMRDEAGSACLGKWRIQAKRTANERGLEPANPPMAVGDLSGKTPVAQPLGSQPRFDRLTILLQASAVRPRAAKLEPEIVRLMANSLLSVCRDLAAKSVRLLVFNVEQQRVLLQKQDFTVDAIGEVKTALDQLDLARIDYRTLQNRDKADLFRELIDKEVRADPAASAVVLLSLRGASKADAALQSDLSETGRSRWYYLQYDPVFRMTARPAFANRRPDTLSRTPSIWGPPALPRSVDPTEQFFRRIKGETFTIRRPEDLAGALRRIFRVARTPAPKPRPLRDRLLNFTL